MKIVKPTIGGHDGSSFRELLDLWEENGYCEIIQGPPQRSSGYVHDSDSPEAKCWVNEIGDILLYDFPLLDRLKHSYNMCLFANEFKSGPNNKRWVFWPKHSRLYDKLKTTFRREYNNRTLKLGFIGTPTNQKRHDVSLEWNNACDLFHYSNQKVNHDEYLNQLSFMKYGLCFRGVGPKCLRDIELMGMGTVPIFTDGVSTEYHNELVEDIHYISGVNKEETLNRINNMKESEWKEMSDNCIEWFEQNCSVEGSFNTTVKIISESNYGINKDMKRLIK